VLLLIGRAIAVITFVCSMGNVPVAAFLKSAGAPVGRKHNLYMATS